MNQTPEVPAGTRHRFEIAGLGLAPFQCVGYHVAKYQACPGAPIQPGAACDFCGTGIMDVFVIESSDGKRFKVGCDCVRKTGDSGLRRVIDAKVREAQRTRRHELATAKYREAQAWLADPEIAARLMAEPHPQEWASKAGKTLLDWAKWMLLNSGDKGRTAVYSTLREYHENKAAK